MATESYTIVLAEDDEGHANLIQRNLRRAGISNPIVHLKDGQEALDFIRGEGPFLGQTPPPIMTILLDINMPRLDGVETLRRLKADDNTKNIPVIMLTTTDDPMEIERCYELGAGVYISKPVDYDSFCEAINRLGMFLQVVQVYPR